MNNKGYTLIELIGLILIMGVVALVTIPNVSKALYDNKDVLYESSVALYLKEAELYGNDIKDEVKYTEYTIVTIGDLLGKGYISNSVDGKVIDNRDNTSMNDKRIKLIYNSDDDHVYAQWDE